LSSEKKILDLIKAYRQLNCQHKTLAIVGDGQLRNVSQDYTEKHSLDSVRFFGFHDRDEIKQYYATADLLVLPSRRETWGIVVDEAMCFGLPVITCD
jgi:glycosyltransferase involved in cell wall biosynthesis